MTTKRAQKTEKKIDSSTISTRVDSTTRLEVRNYIIDQIVSQVDNSKIRLITYYPADSSGKQFLQSEMIIESDITTSISKSSTEKNTIQDNINIKEQVTENVVVEENVDLKTTRAGFPSKYLIFIIISIAIVFIIKKVFKIYML